MQSKLLRIVALFTLFICEIAFGQGIVEELTPRIQAYELDIENTYSEYQKLYYEQKSSEAELTALENIISVYVDQILEIYETLVLSGTSELNEARDIAARSLIFRALTHLEKAELNPEHYELACYDYYEALDLYKDSNAIPVLYKKLPRDLWVGNRRYTRLVTLINEKGKDLFSFGRVEFSFNKFKITYDMDVEALQFVRFKTSTSKLKYTYHLAEKRLKVGFSEALKEKEDITFYLALPEGSYLIRSDVSPLRWSLASIYIRANQQQNYIVEPISDWIILFENPSCKRPNFHRLILSQGADNDKSVTAAAKYRELPENSEKRRQVLVSLVGELVKNCMEDVELNLMLDLSDPWIKSRIIEYASGIIVDYIQCEKFYRGWSNWSLAWAIASQITAAVSPGQEVSMEMIKLVHLVLTKL
ncbi:hypothetical protein JXJ21_06635 [candidate division KSB1 bacterium]|nr:hypothetical protein [candidate division KSB1 bacterium]